MKNLKNNKYAQRLIEEWRIYGKICLAVDFDSTISFWKIDNNEDIKRAIGLIKLAKEIGAFIIIWTACNTDRFEEILKYCNDVFGFLPDGINENLSSLPYGHHKKIYYNHLLDDRAGFEEAMEILEFAAYTIRSEKHSATEQTVEF